VPRGLLLVPVLHREGSPEAPKNFQSIARHLQHHDLVVALTTIDRRLHQDLVVAARTMMISSKLAAEALEAHWTASIRRHLLPTRCACLHAVHAYVP